MEYPDFIKTEEDQINYHLNRQLKIFKKQRRFGYQYKGNGYGFWPFEEAIKRSPQKACIYYQDKNGRMYPLSTKEQINNL